MFQRDSKEYYWGLFWTALVVACLLIGLSFLRMSIFWAGFMRVAGALCAFACVILFANATSNLPIILRGCINTTQKIEDDFLEHLVKDVTSKLSKNKVATDQIIRLMNFCAMLLNYEYDIDELQAKLGSMLNKKVCLQYTTNYPSSSLLAASRSGIQEWSGILSLQIDEIKPLTIKIW